MRSPCTAPTADGSSASDLDDPSPDARSEDLTAKRDLAFIDAARARAAIESAGLAVAPDQIARFAAVARRRMRGHDGGWRGDHLQALAERVEVAEREVRVMGSRNELLRILAATDGAGTAADGVRRKCSDVADGDATAAEPSPP